MQFSIAKRSNFCDVDVTVTDSGKETYISTFEITVLDVNDAPTDITLDNDTIAENQPADTVVGVPWWTLI